MDVSAENNTSGYGENGAKRCIVATPKMASDIEKTHQQQHKLRR